MMRSSVKAYRHILWDWNGTLLHDASLSVESMNRLLERRELPLLDVARYREIFTFPVRDYYIRLGFNFADEPFEGLAAEFVAEFNARKDAFRLHAGAGNVLQTIRQLGIGQSVLSASREDTLTDQVARMGIRGFFTRIAGLGDSCAAGKAERGRALLDELGLSPAEVLLIGDTDHDHEVANLIGCDSLLIGNGHQSLQRLAQCRASMVRTVWEVPEEIQRNCRKGASIHERALSRSSS